MFRSFLTIALCILTMSAFGQELNCIVSYDVSNVQITSNDKSLLEQFKTTAQNFMNTRKWTNDVFQSYEKIDCNIYITITDVLGLGSYKGTATIQASRPVFESTYETTILNYIDKGFTFDYNQSQPFDFNENAFFTNLTSMLGYYAYIIIGIDYDSFSKLGGNPYFEKARNIANVAQSGGDDGWSQNATTPNRYSLIANITNQQYIPMREGFYTYHRLALDQFIKNPDQARKDIFESLKKIKPVLSYDPSSIFIRSFFIAKSAELINIYKEANSEMKNNAVNLLRELDPLNGEKYSMKILNK
jgi:hypothetical protein